MNLTELPLTQLLVISAIFGLLMGSFISMLSWRLPRVMELEEEQQLKVISIERSKCPHCETPLPWYRLFPLFSWLASRGKCHQCKTPISPRYPLIELATAVITTLVVWQFGLNEQGIAALIFSWILITISVIDIEHQLILDNLSFPLLWLGLIFSTQSTFLSPVEAIWGAVVGYLVLWSVYHLFKLVTGKEGMGYGDFKLLAALGAWFGALLLPQIILIAALTSIAFTLINGLLTKQSIHNPMAFGPFLALGGFVTLFFGILF